MVVAALVEAATVVVAEATVAESTHSIQLHPANSKRASWANPTVGPALPYLSSPSPFVAVISAAPRSYMSSTGIYEHRAMPSSGRVAVGVLLFLTGWRCESGQEM